MKYPVEEVFRTEGVPEFTFVKPPNYNEIFVDIRNTGKPTIIEGQSGTGKTTVAKKIIEHAFPHGDFGYLSARKASDMANILAIAEGTLQGKWIIDDFHRLDANVQAQIADLVKVAAENFDAAAHPKLVLIGINKVGSELILLVHDIAKRCGIHRIQPADKDISLRMISRGEEKLNVLLEDKESIFAETEGDYWLTQLTCQAICLSHDILETEDSQTRLPYLQDDVRARIIARLEHSYREPVKEFARGKRFRPTNDPYFRLLRLIAAQRSSIADLNELANANPDVRGSINNIKERRITIVLESKPICDRYFYYNPDTKTFAIEDPAFFYYLQHLDWENMRKDCGFRDDPQTFDWDFAISFAGECRVLAKTIADLLEILDCTVFYDQYYEANYLGTAWSQQFKDIFGSKARYVVCLLDSHHAEKIWPTFERECFTPRVEDAAVIPIYLDDTPFIGIPKDIVGIDFKEFDWGNSELVTDKIVYKLEDKLRNS
ncbi:TIR domain-containing protein [Saccharospirillum impatiens]|uniref:TIR domain-containing protein n=1 Tax=Saccharospirillum impatiens TaxID=169438 RepID=UPI0003FB1E92|nr:TIR domain-containing protein [Saccharospirillum impatiens]